MARFIVTGGSGFIGAALAHSLRVKGHEALIASRGRHDLANERDWVEYDLRDPTTIANLMEARPAGIFHLAWSTTPGTAERETMADVQTNLAGTVALFEAAAGQLSGPLVFVSSGGTVYGEAALLPIAETAPLMPVSIYGTTKMAAELYAQTFRFRHALDIRVARLANPFGSSQSQTKSQGAASIFARKILAGEPITIWGDGEAVRDYLHVDDAAEGLLAVMTLAREASKAVPVYNIGSGEGLSLNELIAQIERLSGVEAKVHYEAPRPFDIRANVLDAAKIRARAGWRPRYSVADGLARVIAEMRHAAPLGSGGRV